MSEKRSVRFVDSDAAGNVGSVEVDDVVLVRGGEPQQLSENQLERARAIAPVGAIRAESNETATRDELNAQAHDAGVENPEGLANKEAVIEATREAENDRGAASSKED